MAKKKKKQSKSHKKKQTTKTLHPLTYEIAGILLIGFALIIFFQFGTVGRGMTIVDKFILGNWHLTIPFLMLVFALLMMARRKVGYVNKRIFYGSCFIIASFALFSHIALFEQLFKGHALLSNSVLKETWRILVSNKGIFDQSYSLGGGMIGAFLFALFHVLFDSAGAKIAAWMFILIGLVLVTGKAFMPWVIEKSKELTQWMKTIDWSKDSPPKKQEISRRRKRKAVEKQVVSELPPSEVEVMEEEPTTPLISAFTERTQIVQPVKTDNKEEKDGKVLETDFQMTESEEQENLDYQLPPATLLREPAYSDQSNEYQSIKQNAQKLEKTFHSFGVKAKVTQVHLGPAVTKYEVLPDTGVKVSKIVSLSDDIALALAARDIRMEAPIPGKSAIGIEVPNQEVAMVCLREVLEAEASKTDSKMLAALGRDITGQAVLAELNKMPHLLVAGSTGSGKSVCINGLIVSILMRAKPHEVKFMMIDPKMVELNVYNGVPHLLAPVVTDARKASQALKKIVSEMERRYDLFSHTGTRNIEGYNEHVEKFNMENDEKHPKLPYIVVIVDELADLMMVASNDVEDAITRLAQMARAAGIHLIIATQRPSVDVITGVIKANIPSRIAFAVSSSIDSRTILDATGADKLLGRGDMLYLPSGASKPVRVQGAFVSDQEVEKVVDFVIAQQKAQYQEDMIPSEIEEVVSDDVDELFEEAKQLVIEMQTASVSLLQRKFRVGYSRAARIVDQLEQHGIIGPYEGSKPRQVLISYLNEEV